MHTCMSSFDFLDNHSSDRLEDPRKSRVECLAERLWRTAASSNTGGHTIVQFPTGHILNRHCTSLLAEKRGRRFARATSKCFQDDCATLLFTSSASLLRCPPPASHNACGVVLSAVLTANVVAFRRRGSCSRRREASLKQSDTG